MIPKRSLVLAVVLALSLGAILAPTFDNASATTCTNTGFTRDGINLTAAVINPAGTVTGDVDASGCNIGVYIDNGAKVVEDANIHGANYFGILVNGDVNNVSADIKGSSIHDIGETPFNGSQHGVAVYYRALGAGTATGKIMGNTVEKYQKGGITVNGAGATVEVTGNTVKGLGKVNFIAQNGVQFGWGANGIARDNEISGNFYTGTVGVGPNPGGQNPPGWQYVSGGLLLYQAGEVKHSLNKYSGNQRNVLVAN